MAKYIYNTPEHITFVKRDDRGNVQLEVTVDTFHNGRGISIDQPIKNQDPFNGSYTDSIHDMNMEEVGWLIDVLQDAEKIMQMKREEEDE